MAISPPSDLVLDVVKAADPMEVQAAQEKLKANRAAFAATSLAENGKGFSNTVDVLDHIGQKSGLSNIQNRAKTEVPESYRKFEAMVLQNFVKSMLPSESEDVYGKGATGDIWKGMMAEQLGNTMAKGDGIGIAKQMYSEQLRRQEGKIVNASTDDRDRNTALSMIDDFQRRTFGTPTADSKTASDT
ncbi:flagellar protein FlgJ [Rhizobium sp. NXC14]|uniref:rod-binding protein n=1 Tax=Rhizobium sp. NXC14 TaxID=1981173 RepID=UPI000A2050DE|nr:rod-binding protein [Rhizobium sp. NXC14]ARO28708.1 flagellar protein FlgJ [Rhizobium sp. NXC14]